MIFYVYHGATRGEHWGCFYNEWLEELCVTRAYPISDGRFMVGFLLTNGQPCLDTTPYSRHLELIGRTKALGHE